MRKGCLVVVVGFIVVVGVVIALWLTRPTAVDSGERFLALISAGETGEAYETANLSESKEEFLARIAALGLDGCAAPDWNGRDVIHNTALLDGTIATADGRAAHVFMVLKKRRFSWTVERLEAREIGRMPSTARQHELVKASVLLLAEAVRAGDFTRFHAGVSRAWQREQTPDEIRRRFEPLRQRGLDLGAAATSVPRFDPAPMIGPGFDRLRLAGTFPGPPQEFEFELEFVWEQRDWKLVEASIS